MNTSTNKATISGPRRVTFVAAAVLVPLLVPSGASAEFLESDGPASVETEQPAMHTTANEAVIMDAFVSPQATGKAMAFVGLEPTSAPTELKAIRSELHGSSPVLIDHGDHDRTAAN